MIENLSKNQQSVEKKLTNPVSPIDISTQGCNNELNTLTIFICLFIYFRKRETDKTKASSENILKCKIKDIIQLSTRRLTFLLYGRL